MVNGGFVVLSFCRFVGFVFCGGSVVLWFCGFVVVCGFIFFIVLFTIVVVCRVSLF